MSREGPYNIDQLPDERSRLRPAVRLAHLLLRECLQAGARQLRLVSATGRAEVERGGTWQAVMAFPPAVYDALADQFKGMAGAATTTAVEAPATLQLSWRGTDVSAAMTEHPGSAGQEDLNLRFSVGHAQLSDTG